MRKAIVAGNWKMNHDLAAGLKLASEVIHMLQDEVPGHGPVIMAPSFVHLKSLHGLLSNSKEIFTCAQDLSANSSGAYTGDVSAEMLRSVGANYVLIGHSERRQHHKESDSTIAKKMQIALNNGLTPILCVGETEDIRLANHHHLAIKNQLDAALFNVASEAQIEDIIIAYEPVWAIGTGQTASPEQAEEMHAYIRSLIAKHYHHDLAEKVSILYGGSCNESNASEIFACSNVDGGLIGGASLKSRSFVNIAKALHKVKRSQAAYL